MTIIMNSFELKELFILFYTCIHLCYACLEQLHVNDIFCIPSILSGLFDYIFIAVSSFEY